MYVCIFSFSIIYLCVYHFYWHKSLSTMHTLVTYFFFNAS
jgi:hypothetical protein